MMIASIALPIGIPLSETIDPMASLPEGYHRMTETEVEILMQGLGIQDPDVDYNEMINGHGTGFAPPSQNDYAEMEGKLVVKAPSSGAMASPESWDLSGEPYFPIVGDQGTLGSCSAWALGYYCYGYLEAKDNGWSDASQGNPAHLISPSWTYNKANGGTDNGAWMGDVGSVLCTWGGATWSTMPYDGDNTVASNYLDWGEEEAFREAPLHRAARVESIIFDQTNWEGTLSQIRSTISSGTPMTFLLDAAALEGTGGDWVVTSTEYNYTALNHAQTIVGYDDTLTVEGEIGAFKVVNSWGADFWDNGYYWITYDALKNTSSENQLTYIVDRTDYQPSILGVWHYSEPQLQDLRIEVSLEGGSSLVAPYYEPSNQDLPSFLCLDLSDLQNEFLSGVNTFVLSTYSYQDGTCSSFRTELYTSGYSIGQPTQVSTPSPNVPASPVLGVRSVLWNYPIAELSDAVDAQELHLTTGGSATWTPGNYTYSMGDLSLQSGDVARSSSSWLSLGLYGSGTLSFDWRMDCPSSSDTLTLRNNGNVTKVITGVTGWEHLSFDLTAAQSNLTWAFERRDNGGGCGWLDNISWSGTGTVADTLPPEITILTPAPGGWLSTSSVTAVWSGLDIGGISYYEVGWDGGMFQNVSLATSAISQELIEGPHTMTVQAYDRAGNMGNASISFFVDLSAPVIYLMPREGTILGSSNVSIVVQVLDPGSGHHNETVRMDGRTVRTSSNNDSVSFTLTLAEGTHVLNVTSIDEAGNYAYGVSNFIVDSLPPELSILSPANGSSTHLGDIYTSWSRSDLAGTPRVERSFDGGPWIDVTNLTHEFLFSLIDGEHDLTLRAIDAFGRVTIARSIFNIDSSLPYAMLLEKENVPLDLPIVVRFSKPVQPTTLVWYSTFLASASWVGNDLVITPTTNLEQNTTYEIRLSANDTTGQGTGQQVLFFTTLGTGTLSGRIIDGSGTPLPGVLVTTGIVSALTSEAGTFQTNLFSGSHNITVHRDGYEDLVFSVNITPGAVLDIGDRTIHIIPSPYTWVIPGVIILSVLSLVAVATYVLVRRKK